MNITMDRYEADWGMVELGWKTHVRGEGSAASRAPAPGGRRRSVGRRAGIIDQDLPAFVIMEGDGKPVGPIRDGAAVILFNFRGDRAIEITRAFEQERFTHFDRGPVPKVFYAGMMQYDGDLHLPARLPRRAARHRAHHG